VRQKRFGSLAVVSVSGAEVTLMIAASREKLRKSPSSVRIYKDIELFKSLLPYEECFPTWGYFESCRALTAPRGGLFPRPDLVDIAKKTWRIVEKSTER
jgi:hypothetical protein